MPRRRAKSMPTRQMLDAEKVDKINAKEVDGQINAEEADGRHREGKRVDAEKADKINIEEADGRCREGKKK